MNLWWNLASWSARVGMADHAGPWILLYHRIASKPHCGGETTPENFAAHLEVLKKNCDCIPLSDLLRRIVDGRATGREATITFDDGYRDQGEAARRAIARGVPATIFIPTAFPGSGRRFFWEGRDAAECERIKEAMRHGAEPPEGPAPSDLLTWDEILKLKHDGVRIESHGHSHRILTGLAGEALRVEMRTAFHVFAEHVGAPPKVLAYPNGDWPDFDDRVDAAARHAGFRFGATAIFGPARRAHLPWRIRRLGVADQSASSLERVLRGGHASAALKAALDDWRGRR